MTIGSRIRYYRTKLGWTLERLSIESGVKPGTIAALEARGSNKSDFIPQIARAFGLSVEQLADTSKDYDVTPAAPRSVPAAGGQAAGHDERLAPPAANPAAAAPTNGLRRYSREALDLASEFDAIRSKRWQRTAYSYCMQVMNRDPLMMAWLSTLTSSAKSSAAAPQSHKPSTHR